MKNRRAKRVAAAGLFGLAGITATAGAQTAAPDSLADLDQGKSVFERSCGVCHGLERALSKSFDRAGWESTVERMHDNGAEASGAERARVVAYLLAKNAFEAKCSGCHGTDRSLERGKSAAGWTQTVQRMAGMQPGLVTAAEAADIAAYLAVIRPEPKGK